MIDLIWFLLSAYFSVDPSGWWTGRIRGREGLFPGNYVEKIWARLEKDLVLVDMDSVFIEKYVYFVESSTNCLLKKLPVNCSQLHGRSSSIMETGLLMVDLADIWATSKLFCMVLYELHTEDMAVMVIIVKKQIHKRAKSCSGFYLCCPKLSCAERHSNKIFDFESTFLWAVTSLKMTQKLKLQPEWRSDLKILHCFLAFTVFLLAWSFYSRSKSNTAQYSWLRQQHKINGTHLKMYWICKYELDCYVCTVTNLLRWIKAIDRNFWS